MENLYFPLFLVLVAVGVIWLFNRARNGSASERRSSKRSTGRLKGADLTSQRREGLGYGARLQSGQGQATRGDIWKTKREQATKESFSQSSSRGVFHAGYIGPEFRGSGAHEIKDQDVDESELAGIDEYLTKREREERARKKKEAREAAEAEGGLSMTAMKYEPVNEQESSEEEDTERKKQAGFKP